MMREFFTKGLDTLFVDVPSLRPWSVGAYALALVAVAIATALEAGIDRYVGGARYVTFLLPVVFTALVSSLGASLFCLAISVAAVHFFLLRPGYSVYDELLAVPALALFVFAGLSSVLLITGMRSARERKDLQVGKERLQLALDTAGLGWWQHDPRRRVCSGDARFNEIFDVSGDEVPIEEFRDRMQPEDAERFWQDHFAKLDPTGPLRSTEEYRLRRRDGEVRWVRVCWLAYLEDAGRERRVASVIGTAQDITEHKECTARERLFAEREHLLARESAHRAKNLISVVDAIAHQTAARNPEDFVERFSDRMQALSANQDMLIRNEWKGVEIKGLVLAQLAHFADLIGSRISVEGRTLRVKANAAQAIGLALHELATNAGKYGAFSTDRGRVEIRWRTDGETFTMSWTEREGPPVSAPQRRGFGTVVMKEMAERSVDGRVELGYAPSGVTWSLTCPAANALEPTV
jgi:PAS domain S-box-containing protein